MHGMDTVHPPDGLPANKFAYAQNVRAYIGERTSARAQEDPPVLTLPSSVHSLRRLNDLTPAGPSAGFVLVGGAGGSLYANGTQVASGLSGDPLSLIPFRPAASVQPWMYVGDSAQWGVTIDSSSGSIEVIWLAPNGMLKVRSDGVCYAMGVEEPHVAPSITSVPAASQPSLIGAVTVSIWGDSPHAGPVAQYIWKNANDAPGSGPIRNTSSPSVVTSGNSLLFDVPPVVSAGGDEAVQWTTYQTNFGNVNTDTTGGTFNVHWVSGDQFNDLSPAGKVTINAVTYTILAVVSNVLLHLTTSAGIQNDVVYQAVASSGTQPLFQPALESQGYRDFNCCIEATLYIPAAGNYTFELFFKDDIIWGIGNSATGVVTRTSYYSGPGPQYGPINSLAGQTKTALNGYPLLPRNPNAYDSGSKFGEEDVYGHTAVALSFSAPGNYPIEIDWDYWYHSGRILEMLYGGVGLLPIPGTVISSAQYRYTYRSSATGATSNPSPESAEQGFSVLANSLAATPSPDPQVDKIDWYRIDTALANFTYVGTGPNSSAQFRDILLDTDIVANPLLEFDNYQPFPSIDLPRGGTVDVTGGVVTWVSGDMFNTRWLPGTIIIIGTVAYTLDRRPTSPLQLTASNAVIQGGIAVVAVPPDGTGLVYEIAEPDLAAQPLPYLFGPTDNINFVFGVGDPLRPGTLYWCKGNNLDSAPDTNQLDVTSPSEVLVNGAMSGGRGVLFSTERAWLIMPNFFNALATVQGTVGSTWTLQESSINRGLYIPKCLAIEASGNIFFRVKDGIEWSGGGAVSKSISEDIYNLFTHEGSVPQPVTRGPFTVWPPDDTQPEYQSMECANGYLYYDYLDVNGYYRTLVYDIQGKGWVVDAYQYPVRIHRLEEGGNVNGTLVGCSDGSVRPLVDSGVELACAVVLTRCETAGDVRAQKHWGDIYVEGEND
jgi:hypothetical protein